MVPEVDERELEKMVNPIVQEYFEHGDTKEVQVRPHARLVGLHWKVVALFGDSTVVTTERRN